MQVKVKGKDVGLGDKMYSRFEYSWSTVVKIEQNDGTMQGSRTVHLVRPYIHTSDVEYGFGLLWYIGVEQYSIFVYDDKEYSVVKNPNELR